MASINEIISQKSLNEIKELVNLLDKTKSQLDLVMGQSDTFSRRLKKVNHGRC